jgi:biopolymer transport protein ExbB
MLNLELLSFTLLNDWPVLLPILASSIVLGMVVFDRLQCYKQHQRDLDAFIPRLQRELYKNNIDNALALGEQLGGLVGSVVQEGLQLYKTGKQGFSKAFDITIMLAVKRLESKLNVLGTIGTIAPYLGLFGTVVRILLTFGDMAKASAGGASGTIMFGIGSALIATALGLAVAIAAVVANNLFRDQVERFENDFQLLKLVFLSAAESNAPATPTAGQKQPQLTSNGIY